MKIFISHSSKDKDIVTLFTEKIIIGGCGISEREVFCTSVEGLGIKTGHDFREHIKSTLLNCDFSFLLISSNYKKSEICLNEMGASWAIENLKVKPFIFPNLNFHSIGTLYEVKQASYINDSYALDDIFEELTTEYSTLKSVSRWNKAKHEYLNELNKLLQKGLPDTNVNEYFSQFLQPNVNLNSLLLSAHPTYIDCKNAFTLDYAARLFHRYCVEFENLAKEYMEPFYPKYSSFRVISGTTEDIGAGRTNFPGGMTRLYEENKLNPNVRFYRVKFLNNGKEGSSLGMFCYVNDHWVLFPKPYW